MSGKRWSYDPPTHEEQQHGDEQQGSAKPWLKPLLATALSRLRLVTTGAMIWLRHFFAAPRKRGARQCQPGPRPEQEAEARQ
jgi:hypothetical protein